MQMDTGFRRHFYPNPITTTGAKIFNTGYNMRKNAGEKSIRDFKSFIKDEKR